MAKGIRVSVTVTAVKVEDEGGKISGEQVYLTNRGTVSVFLGDSAVTNANGYELAAGQTIGPLALTVGDQTIYAAAASGTQRLDVLAL